MKKSKSCQKKFSGSFFIREIIRSEFLSYYPILVFCRLSKFVEIALDFNFSRCYNQLRKELTERLFRKCATEYGVVFRHFPNDSKNNSKGWECGWRTEKNICDF